MPMHCQSMSMLFANPLPIQKPNITRVKYSTFSAANHPNPCQSGFFIKSRDWRISTGLADWRRLAEIGYHCQARVKPPMQCQCANPGRIRCQSRAHFGLAKSRQSMVIEVNPAQYQYQSGTNPGSDQNTVCCQSNTNLPPISCQSLVNARPPRNARASLHCQSIVNPVPIHCHSMPIQCRSSYNLSPIKCQPIQI